ncbi:MAG TPA: hypothetical protein VF126_09220 [Acidobacteriaceae bacterium]
MRTRSFLNLAVVFLVVAPAQFLNAQQTRPGTTPPPYGPPNVYVEPDGVPLAPPIYLVNFLLLYVSNPEIAAYMPAYRVALPQEVYQCLFENPDGCPYPDMAPFFAEQALDSGGSQNKNSFWPSSCQTDPRWRSLAPPENVHPDQINEPLGRKRADRIAALLGIDQSMILTDQEYQCLIGQPPRDVSRAIIYACSANLTNSNGNTEIPLSSYGLYLNEKGDVRSDCAPHAPCLEFNKLFAGPLEAIAKQCGFADKLARMVAKTLFLEFVQEGSACQHAWFPSCIAEAACPGNGGQSNNSCSASLAHPQ